MIDLVILILVTLCIGGVYFLPSIVAIGKRNSVAIFLLNLFLGWTFFGWVGAFVWAACKDKD